VIVGQGQQDQCPAANACVRCGLHCDPSDLAGVIPLGDGWWEHLACWLRDPRPLSLARDRHGAVWCAWAPPAPPPRQPDLFAEAA
jgi:hypothetical protein